MIFWFIYFIVIFPLVFVGTFYLTWKTLDYFFGDLT